MARSVALGLLLFLAAANTACTSTRQDVALAPLWTHIRTAGGGREVEALAGIVRTRHRTLEGPLHEWALRPFVKETIEENGDRDAGFLVPLGRRRVHAFDSMWRLLPIVRFERSTDPQGHPKWSLITLPLTYWAEDNTDRVTRAVFPFGGVLEKFLTFDRVEFALFPLYLRTVRDGQNSINFLWPIFNWTYGPHGTSYRIWPIFGRLRHEGRFDKKFFLWPFFQWSVDHLDTAHPERSWMLWPLVGHRVRGSYHAETFLWPFFGYAADPNTGYWSWDGPWPLVRFTRPGSDDPNGPRRSRVWPFWSSYEGDGLKSHYILFPLINWRETEDRLGTGKGNYVVPIWQYWEKKDKQGVETSWTKLWPLFQNFKEGDKGRFAFPALNPLWHMPEIDDHYAWIYELVTRTRDGPRVSVRSWGNLYRREIDETEDRSYLSFLWSRRAFRAGGEPQVEHSLLFGLLRWRSYPERDGFLPDLMTPSFPGPGWPMQPQLQPPMQQNEAPKP